MINPINITHYIPEGRDNKISRASLSICTGLPDRSVRRLISEAREQGIPIVGDPEGGYYMAESEADVRLLLSELNSRIGKLAKCVKAIREKAL